MSILEIVIIIILGLAVTAYCAFSIYRIVDRKKRPYRYDENGKLIKNKKGSEEE